MHLEEVAAAIGELIGGDLILCVAVGHGDFHIPQLDVVNGAALAVDVVHRFARGADVFEGHIADDGIVFGRYTLA